MKGTVKVETLPWPHCDEKASHNLVNVSTWTALMWILMLETLSIDNTDIWYVLYFMIL